MEQHVDIRTPDGIADGLISRPEGAQSLPGVIVLTDIYGLRQASDRLSDRIAQQGFVVLTPNIFYRTGKPPIFEPPIDFQSEKTQARFKEIIAPLTPDAMAKDGSSYINFLAAQPGVLDGPMGMVGFCFSGKFAMRVAADRPDKVAACASFHGAGLINDAPDSPHLVLPDIRARLYFGHAENDRGMPAEAIGKFEDALEAWGGEFESETYPAGHGWMMDDKEVYNAEQAERGFQKLMELFKETLNRSPASVR